MVTVAQHVSIFPGLYAVNSGVVLSVIFSPSCPAIGSFANKVAEMPSGSNAGRADVFIHNTLRYASSCHASATDTKFSYYEMEQLRIECNAVKFKMVVENRLMGNNGVTYGT